MLNRTSKIIVTVFSVIVLVSCNGKEEVKPGYLWGETECFNDFLWKKYKPDTLYQNIRLDFNEDAQMFMEEPVEFGIFKKADDGRLIQVLPNEMEVFVNGIKAGENVIVVQPTDKNLRVGIVLNRTAEDKVHNWFIKPVKDGGLERINNMPADDFNKDDVALQHIQLEKKHIANPLAVCVGIIGAIIIALLLLWLLIIKHIVYPSFRVGRVNLRDPLPYMKVINVKHCRQLVLTSKPNKQTAMNKLFTGKIQYEIDPMWTSEISIEPRDSNSVRIRPSKDYLVSSRTLKKNVDYEIINQSTKPNTKTIIRIS